MRKIIPILTLFLTTIKIFGQCNCEKVNRDDGTKIIQCYALPVAYDNITEVGLAASSNGQEKFVTVTVRFKETALNISGNLSLRLIDNNLITLELVNSALSFIGNSQVAHGIFLTNETDIAKLKKSEIITISFKLKDGLIRTYQVSSYSDILKTQFHCL